MKQNKIINAHALLNEKGQLVESGYATELLLNYNRKDIKASKLRAKEWDYYFIGNEEFGLSLTIADNSYMGLASAQVFDYIKGEKKTNFAFIPFPMGKMKMPSSSKYGDISYKNKNVEMQFINNGSSRKLYCDMPNFNRDKKLVVDIELYDIPKDSMVIVTPFAEDDRAFYYNQKINCMKVRGKMIYGDKQYNLDNMLAVLDWGRGVWTYDNTWYWGSMSTYLENGDTFGFNIGYGFGDTTKATENMLFYNGKAHKLELVDFGIPFIDGKEDFMSNWHFTSNDDRLDMIFEPLYDNRTHLNALLIAQNAHQVFGKFTGKAVLDNGKVVHFKDCFGFAEKVRNKW